MTITPAPTDLTTLGNLKSYLVNPGNLADATLQRMLSAASKAIENYINRDIVPMAYTKTYDGVHNRVLVPDDYPIINVSSVTIDGTTVVPAGSVTVAGFYFTDKEILLNGYRFSKGRGNVQISFTAGHQITAEAQTIAATTFQAQPAQPKGSWTSDQGVIYAATGVALKAVIGTPTTGQYNAPSSINNYVYQFAAADVGLGVLLTYGYAPFDLEQAALILVQYWLGDRNRSGEKSRTMGGQTITFNTADMPDTVRTIIRQWARVF